MNNVGRPNDAKLRHPYHSNLVAGIFTRGETQKNLRYFIGGFIQYWSVVSNCSWHLPSGRQLGMGGFCADMKSTNQQKPNGPSKSDVYVCVCCVSCVWKLRGQQMQFVGNRVRSSEAHSPWYRDRWSFWKAPTNCTCIIRNSGRNYLNDTSRHVFISCHISRERRSYFVTIVHFLFLFTALFR